MSVAHFSPTAAASCSSRRPLQVAAHAGSSTPRSAPAVQRRALLASGAAAALAAVVASGGVLQAAAPALASEAGVDPGLAGTPAAAAATPSGITILSDQPGSGTAAAQKGDLVLVHYVGTTTAEGTLFDSTRGGQAYRDGGMGALRPVIIRLGGEPVPGICEGLNRGIAGMRVGGRRTFAVPPALGFGSGMVLGPYGVVPGGSEVRYEVELLRLSRQGPDALMSGVSQCGGGVASERTSGCAAITPAEFV